MPKVTVVNDALLTAQRLDDETKSAVGAVYDATGRLVTTSVRGVDRLDRWLPGNPESMPEPPRIIGAYRQDGPETFIEEAIFGGYVLATWGHIITETLCTAWAAPTLPAGIPLVLTPWGRWWKSSSPRLRTLLSLAGWGDRPLIVTSGATAFGRLHVPDQLVHLDSLMHQGGVIDPVMNATYDRVVEACGAEPGGPVLLARPEGHRRAHPAELDISAALGEAGVRVVRGWELDIEEQVRIAAGASALLGFSGSNLHNSVFASRVPVIEIQDHRSHVVTRAGVRGLQGSLCALRGQRLTFVPGHQGGDLAPVPAARIVDATLAAVR